MSHDDEESPRSAGGRHTEFECPECTANNPMDDGFSAGEEIRCNYCGCEFKVLARDGGGFRLKLQ